MTTHDISTIPAETAAPSKAQIVNGLLSRKTGASVPEISSATNWQPHSVRAFLSGLRKKGVTLDRQERRDGTKAYRMVKLTPAARKTA